jgi:hypothetical protein
MAHDLTGVRVAILATDGVERVELEQPRGALYGAGVETELLSIHSGEIQARQFDLVSAGTFAVDKLVTDASPDDYDALLLPGGTVNPDQLRTDAGAVAFVKAFAETGKPVAAICGSDLHMYEGRTDFEEGRIFGHENVGEVGDAVDKVEVGDMISAPFNVACGHCRNCEEQRTNYCLRANKPGIAGAAYGFADMGPWQGGQAELLRVPWADFNALVLPEDARDKQDDYVMLSDIFPTGWHAMKMSGLLPGETIVIYGGGPVGSMAALSAIIMGAAKSWSSTATPTGCGWPSRSARSPSTTPRAPRSSRSWSKHMAWAPTAAPNVSATKPTTPKATKTTP